MLKRLSKRIVTGLGYDVHKIREPEPPFVPYLEHYDLSYLGSAKACTFDFWIANSSAEKWYKTWFHQAPNPTWELDEFSWIVNPGDRILEIGCHHGFLSCMLADRIGPDGYLLAIDANPENVLITSAQFALNGLGNFCTARNLAAADSPGTLSLEWKTNSHVSMARSDAVTYSVRAVTGDELDEAYGPFSLLKVDVEGFEVAVLRGCRKLLGRKPKILLEVHPEFMANYGYGTRLEDIWSLIEASDYAGTIVTRPRFDVRIPFGVDKMPGSEVSNVHLAPLGSREASVLNSGLYWQHHV